MLLDLHYRYPTLSISRKSSLGAQQNSRRCCKLGRKSRTGMARVVRLDLGWGVVAHLSFAGADDSARSQLLAG